MLSGQHACGDNVKVALHNLTSTSPEPQLELVNLVLRTRTNALALSVRWTPGTQA